MKTLAVLVLGVLPIMVFSQVKVTEKVNMTWGEEIKKDRKTRFYDVVTFDETSYYMAKSGKVYSIDKYDQNLNLSNTLDLDLKYNKKDMSNEGLTYFQDNIVLLSSFSDKKAKTNTLFYQVIDKNAFSQNNKLTELSQFSFEKKRRDGSFGYDKSRDSTKLLIYSGKPYIKDAPEKFGFNVFDESMNELWKKDIELPYTEQLFALESYSVSNKGNVFLTGIEYKDKKSMKKRSGKPEYKYHILGYFDNGKRIKDYEVDLGDKFITDLSVTIRDNEDLVCTGFYSENGTWSIGGVFFLIIDGETKEVKQKNFKKFDDDFITEGWTDRQEVKSKKKAARKEQKVEMYNYELRELIEREDGGALLLAEQYYMYVTTHTSTDSKGNTTTTHTYHYVYNDIIVVNINPDGSIQWTTKIEKNQQTTNDGGYFSSFSSHVKDDKVYLIYNENAKQFYDKEERKEMDKKDKKAKLTLLVEVDGEGNSEKELLFNNRTEGVITRPKVSEQISSESSILYTQWRKTQKILQLDFK